MLDAAAGEGGTTDEVEMRFAARAARRSSLSSCSFRLLGPLSGGVGDDGASGIADNEEIVVAVLVLGPNREDVDEVGEDEYEETEERLFALGRYGISGIDRPRSNPALLVLVRLVTDEGRYVW